LDIPSPQGLIHNPFSSLRGARPPRLSELRLAMAGRPEAMRLGAVALGGASAAISIFQMHYEMVSVLLPPRESFAPLNTFEMTTSLQKKRAGQRPVAHHSASI